MKAMSLLIGLVLLLHHGARAYNMADLKRVFLTGAALRPYHLHDALLSEHRDISTRNEFIIACGGYADHPKLLSFLALHRFDATPVFNSWKEHRICHAFNAEVSPEFLMSAEEEYRLDLTIVPDILKIDESLLRLLDSDTAKITPQYVLELSHGLGLRTKGLANDHPVQLAANIVSLAARSLRDPDLLSQHWKAFYFTRTSDDKNKRTIKDGLSGIRVEEMDDKWSFRSKNLRSVSEQTCNFHMMSVETSRSHLSFLSNHQSTPPHCVVYLATIAVASGQASYAVGYHGFVSLQGNTSSFPFNASNGNATDQNAWIQSGNSIDKPFTDMGITGKGYTVGYADSGVDDLSCFLVDVSGTHTTRTARADASNPVNEFFRRKVVQYVAYSDGWPSVNYDHGTWCSAAAVGKCIFGDSNHQSAEPYNGLMPDGKLSMFDVSNRDTGVFFVPSLYELVFPAAASSGARVHSDSWGCRGITSYTHKALDVDEYMYDHPEFLVVAAAGNDGMLGMDSVGSPGNSKNALTIGASAKNHNDLIYFSGRGKAFPGIIKPDVIGPGTALYSAGVGTDGVDAQSCNVQISSGTSMATPIIAAASAMVQQYFEQGFYAAVCNSTYEACTNGVVPLTIRQLQPSSTGFISSALIKAVMVNSAQNMQQYASASLKGLISLTNLTTPPDRYQGWGQVVLNTVLQTSSASNFTLFVEDYKQLSELTSVTYVVVITEANKDIRVTITWNDPPNVMWAAKNLLNDIDLQVIDPVGNHNYGNNIQGDEFNSVERVVIQNAVVGVYQVVITAKKFGYGSEQLLSLVINCHGYVDVKKTSTSPVNIKSLTPDVATQTCDQAGGGVLVRMQFEDWNSGLSWLGVYFTVEQESGNGEMTYIGTFQSNFDRADAATNRIEQFNVCLYPKVNYVARIINIASSDTTTTNLNLIRVVSPQCNMFLSSLQPTQNLFVNGEKECNICPTGNTLIEIVMFANVTDDDSEDYTWYGLARYTITPSANTEPMFAGTLLVSDEEADRYCVPNGEYVIELIDVDLFASRQKHASIAVIYGGTVKRGALPSDVRDARISLYGSSKVTVVVGNAPLLNMDAILRYSIILAVVVSCCLCIGIHCKYRYVSYPPLRDEEGIPLIDRQNDRMTTIREEERNTSYI